MPGRTAIIQSNYLPWKGYFDIIHDVDTFVFHDDLQYTKGDWRNRNRIKTAAGDRWLTVPVGTSEHRRICDVPLPRGPWARDHWRRIVDAYRRAPFFADYSGFFQPFYERDDWTGLAALNQALIEGIARNILGLPTRFVRSEDFALTATKGARVIELLSKLGATDYVSGPAARDYITDADFARAGISVVWKDYGGYPEYPQLHPPFSHHVSILDLIFNTGPLAPWHIWGWRDHPRPAGLA